MRKILRKTFCRASGTTVHLARLSALIIFFIVAGCKQNSTDQDSLAKSINASSRLQEEIWIYKDKENLSNEESRKVEVIKLELLEALNSPPEKTEAFRSGGMNKPRKAFFSRGVTGLYKGYEASSDEGASELLSYEIDQLYGFNFVPAAVSRELDGKEVLLKYFVNGATHGKALRDFQEENPQDYASQRYLIYLFDMLTQNRDRRYYDPHRGNFFFAPSLRKLIAADNDRTQFFNPSINLYVSPDTPTIEGLLKTIKTSKFGRIERVYNHMLEDKSGTKLRQLLEKMKSKFNKPMVESTLQRREKILDLLRPIFKKRN